MSPFLIHQPGNRWETVPLGTLRATDMTPDEGVASLPQRRRKRAPPRGSQWGHQPWEPHSRGQRWAPVTYVPAGPACSWLSTVLSPWPTAARTRRAVTCPLGAVRR